MWAMLPASAALVGLALYARRMQRRRVSRVPEPGLTRAQQIAFESRGYVVVPGLLGDEDLDPLQEEFEGVLDTICTEAHARGAIPSTYSQLPFHERYLALCKATGNFYSDPWRPALPGALHAITERTPCHFGTAVFGLIRNTKLLSAVGSLIGDEITSNPIQNARIKPPEACLQSCAAGLGARGIDAGLVGVTPWHQDNGVCTADADQTAMVTAWVPLHDVDADNAPLIVLPCSHRWGLQQHCVSSATKEVHLPSEAIDRLIAKTGLGALTLPMRRGDVLLLHPRLVHTSAPNRAERVRFSFDLRYNATGQPTGRAAFPAFVVRSRSDPASECRHHAEWAGAWLAARQRYADEAAAARRSSGTEHAQSAPVPVPVSALLGRERWINHPDAIPCA